MYVKRFHIEEKVINSLNKLEFEFQIIYFDSKLRLWTTLSDNESVLCELGESKIHKKFHYNPEFFKYLSIGFGNEFVYSILKSCSRFAIVFFLNFSSELR